MTCSPGNVIEEENLGVGRCLTVWVCGAWLWLDESVASEEMAQLRLLEAGKMQGCPRHLGALLVEAFYSALLFSCCFKALGVWKTVPDRFLYRFYPSLDWANYVAGVGMGWQLFQQPRCRIV